MVDIEYASLPHHLLLQYFWECLRDEVQSRKLSSCFKALSPNMQGWSTLDLVPGTCEDVDPLADKSSNPEHSSYTASTSVHCTSTQPFTKLLEVPCPHTGHSSYTGATQVPHRCRRVSGAQLGPELRRKSSLTPSLTASENLSWLISVKL